MRKYFPQGVLWCKKPEREHGARQPLPLTAAVFFACAAMPRNRAKRDAKNSRSAERGCSSVLTPPNRRRMAMPPHTPLKHPAMSLLCIHIPQNSCTIFVILLCRGRLIAANSIYLISIVRLPHVGRAATKILSRLQIKNKPNVK